MAQATPSSHKPTNPAPSMLHSFKQGLTESSGLSTLIAIVFAGTTILAGCSFVDEAWMSQNGWRFVRGEEDTNGVITQRALQLRMFQSERPACVILGDTLSEEVSSSSPESFFSIGSDVPEIYDLRTSSQSLWESLALSDQIARHTTGVVLLELSPATFATGIDQARQLDEEPPFGFRSPAVTVELQRHDQPTVPVRGNYLLDNYLYLLRRLPIGLKNSFSTTRSSTLPIARQTRSNASSSEGTEHLQLDESQFKLNLTLLERLLDRLQSTRKVHPVVVFDSGTPVSDTTQNDASDYFEQIREITDRQHIKLLKAGETSFHDEELSPATLNIVREQLKTIASQPRYIEKTS